jgi:Peptidase M15
MARTRNGHRYRNPADASPRTRAALRGSEEVTVNITRSTKLSPHVSVGEFFPRGTGPRTIASGFLPARRLCRNVIEPLRAKFGRVIVHSGYRNAARNARVGGAPRSYHVMGLRDWQFAAADISFEHGTPAEWARAADRLGVGGLGEYPTHIHVDTRSGRARWTG